MYDGVVRVEIDIGMVLPCTVCAPMEISSIVRLCKHLYTKWRNVACPTGLSLVGRTRMYVLSSWPGV